MRARNRTLATLALITAGVLVGMVLSQFWITRPGPEPEPSKIHPLPVSPADLATKHLDWASVECEKAVDEQVKTLDTLFTDAKKNTPKFAEEALGWSSKWRIVVDKLPFTRTDRHAMFLKERFGECVMQPDLLEQVVKQVVDNYLKQVASIEGQMLVKIRLDIAGLPGSPAIATLDGEKLQIAFDAALARSKDAAGKDLQSTVARELLVVIASEFAAQTAARLGVSAGILGTGAAAGWSTFGITVVASVIIDYIISYVWDWFYDPKGQLCQQIDKQLDDMRQLLVDGAEGKPGLVGRLKQFARDRAVLRGSAIVDLVTKPSGGSP